MQILVIDDHVLVREGLCLLLAGLEGAESIDQVTCFSDAEEKIVEVDYDLLLLDYHLPDRAGAEALRTLVSRCRDAPVVVISGDCEPSVVRGALAAGARGFIPKQSTPDVMLAALTVVLRGGVYVPPEALGDSMSQPLSRQGGGRATHELTARQRDVLELLVAGLTSREIATEIGTTESTVRVHISAILRALRVENRAEACRVAVEQGWLEQRG